jgi:hypothetical protein
MMDAVSTTSASWAPAPVTALASVVVAIAGYPLRGLHCFQSSKELIGRVTA